MLQKETAEWGHKVSYKTGTPCKPNGEQGIQGNDFKNRKLGM